MAADRVKADAVASVATAAKGQTFDVALRFKIAKDWHLYWINPGETGQAPRVTWTAPAGVTVGDLKFPVPEKLITESMLATYGYEHELVLLAPVTVGPEVKGPIELKADVDLIVCKSECESESEKIALSIPVADASTPANEADFATWRAQQPQRDNPPKADVKIAADRKAGEVRIELPKGAQAAGFFAPAVPFADFEPSSQTVTEGDKQFHVTRFRVLPGDHKDLAEVAILQVKSADGKVISYEIPCRFTMNRG